MTKLSFDVIIVADFRYPGGTSSAVAAEVRALRRGGHSVALIQVYSPILRGARQWNDRIQALVESGYALVLDSGLAASCHLLLLHSPWLFKEPQAKPPWIESGLRILVTHHTPTDANGRLNYDPVLVDRYASEAFGGALCWAPISPVCRDSFDEAGMTQPRLRDDWTNVVFVEDWGQARRGLLGERPVVGRHSRPQLEKWPASRAELLAAYPDDMEVRLLGVGDQVRALMEPFPDRWHIWDFNAVPVADFLAGIDFFIYFHHPGLIESFGLTIAEAAAAGCIVITHPYLQKTFGKAALYCLPEQAPALVRSIAEDPRRFTELSAQGRKAVDDQFGPEGYLRRLRRLLAAAQDPALLKELVVQPEGRRGLWLRNYAKRCVYWSRNGISPRWQKVLQNKAVRRPVRKIKKALTLR